VGVAVVADLASALRRAAAAHGEHEKRIGKADPDWPDWYAAFIVAEQAGTELPRLPDHRSDRGGDLNGEASVVW
jgi:hypothetical protein